MSIRKGGQIIAGAPRETGGVEIGDVGIAPFGIDESLNLRRYLNGQIISQSQFASFTNKVKAAVALFPNLSTTETNWQSEKNLSKLGQCGKFVIDDTAGTIRLPCVVNAQGLLSLSGIGNLVGESLPNINGGFTVINDGTGTTIKDSYGCCELSYPSKNYAYTTATQSTATYGVPILNINAFRSSSTYQDNAPVQQEAVQYPYYIQVATGVEETLPAIREYKTNVPYVLGDSKYFEANPYNASWLLSNGQYNAKITYPDMWAQLQVELNSSLNKGDTVVIDGKTYVKRGLPVVLSTNTITDYDWVVNTGDETFRLPLLNGERVLVDKKEATAQDRRWYNLYSDGWLEQGCDSLSITTGEYSVSFLKSFKDTLFTYIETTWTRGGDFTVRNTVPVINKKTTSSVIVQSTPNFTNLFGYVVYGYSQIPSSSVFTCVNGLYYYVGDTVQDASLINAGAVLGQLATKTNSVEAAAASMPSGRYIDLTLGASGSTHTAPANGWFLFYGITTGNQGVDLINSTSGDIGMICQQYAANHEIRAYVPCKKGDNVVCNYTATNNLAFRFIYAEGDQ